MSEKPPSARDPILFLLIVLALSWLVFWGPIAVLKIPAASLSGSERGPVWSIVLFIFGGFSPSLLAIAMTAIGEGRAGLRNLFGRVVRVGMNWRWYLAAVSSIAVGTSLQIMIITLLGQRFDLRLFISSAGSLVPLIILGPLSEELGWRGYAQHKLQAIFNPLLSSLLVGVVWALWHLPLFYMIGTSQHELGVPFFEFAVGVVSTSVIIGWIYQRSGSSVWSAVFFHWLYTYGMQVVWTGVVRTPLYNRLEYLPYLVIAVIVAVVWSRTIARSR